MFICLTDNESDADRWCSETIFRGAVATLVHGMQSLLEQKVVIILGNDRAPFSPSSGPGIHVY